MFDPIKRQWPWRSIKGCPGRWVLEGGPSDLSVAQLLTLPEEAVSVQRFEHEPDTIIVFPFVDGGIISYEKKDGRLVHTLGDASGFKRKCIAIGIWSHLEADDKNKPTQM